MAQLNFKVSMGRNINIGDILTTNNIISDNKLYKNNQQSKYLVTGR